MPRRLSNRSSSSLSTTEKCASHPERFLSCSFAICATGFCIIDETELEVLKSRNNLLKIVDSLQLAYSYYKKGALRDEPLYEDNAVSVKMNKSNLLLLKDPINIEISPAGDDTYDIKASTYFEKVKEEKKYSDVKLPFSIDFSRGTVEIERSPVIKDFDYTEQIYIHNPKSVAKEMSENLNIEFAKNSEKIMRVSLRDQVQKRGVDILECLLDFYNQDINTSECAIV